jgi:hypothetical protein
MEDGSVGTEREATDDGKASPLCLQRFGLGTGRALLGFRAYGYQVSEQAFRTIVECGCMGADSSSMHREVTAPADLDPACMQAVRRRGLRYGILGSFSLF